MSVRQLDMRITNACQLRCKHCYFPRGERHNQFMSVDVFKNIVHEFSNLDHPTKDFRVILSGGESLMHPLFTVMVDFLRSIKQTVRISSNGILIPKFINMFEPHDGIQISIDGDEETHDYIRGLGVYDIAVNALKLLEKKGIHHSVYTVLCKENIHCVEHIAQLCKDTNSALTLELFQPLNHTKINPITYKKWDNIVETTVKLYPDLCSHSSCVKTGCDARIMGLTVLHDGTYWDCARNQKVLGKYPSPLNDIMLWDCINNRKTISPFETCCKNIIEE